MATLTAFPLRALLQSGATAGQVVTWNDATSRWEAGGNVGIGTAPTQTLDVLRVSAPSGASYAIRGKYTYDQSSASSLIGLNGTVISQHASGLTSTVVAFEGVAKHEGMGDVTNLRGGMGTAWHAGGGAVTDAVALFANVIKTGGGTITNAIGLRIPNLTAGTNNYAIYSLGGILYHAGSMGVGTLSPNAKVDFLATTEQLRLSYNAAAYAAFTVASDGNLSVSTSGGAVTLPTLTVTGSLDQFLTITGTNATVLKLTSTSAARTWWFGAKAVTADGSLVIYDATAAQVRLLIDTTGQIGVGTNTPDSVFHVLTAANATIKIESTAGVPFFLLETGLFSGRIWWVGCGIIGGTGHFAIYDATAAAVRLFIETDGKVGIGVTSSLGAKVHVLATTEQLRLGYDATNYLSVTVASTGLTTLSQSGAGISLGASTSEKVGFYGTAPVVQQVLATGGGATVDNVITFLQTIGLCKQA